jgi:hypothetical protein
LALFGLAALQLADGGMLIASGADSLLTLY